MSLYTGVRSPAKASCSSHTLTNRCSLRERCPPTRLQRVKQTRCAPEKKHRRATLHVCAASSSSDYYETLGVPRDADLKQIKQAFKRKALKLHPDVNKAPDAKERFMECKRAYQALSDSRERARYDRSGRGGAGPAGGFSWDDVVSGGEHSKKAAEEAFYGLGDFFRDLDRDLGERRARRGKPAQPMSLWEELADIGETLGEELVEFLEKGIGLSAPDSSTDSTASSAAGSAGSASGRSNGGSGGSEDGAARAEAAARQAQERAQRAAASAEAGAQRINDEIEDMLAQMKRDLGIK